MKQPTIEQNINESAFEENKDDDEDDGKYTSEYFLIYIMKSKLYVQKHLYYIVYFLRRLSGGLSVERSS